MKTQPCRDELVGFVEILRTEFGEFESLVESKKPLEWVPGTYRVV